MSTPRHSIHHFRPRPILQFIWLSASAADDYACRCRHQDLHWSNVPRRIARQSDDLGTQGQKILSITGRPTNFALEDANPWVCASRRHAPKQISRYLHQWGCVILDVCLLLAEHSLKLLKNVPGRSVESSVSQPCIGRFYWCCIRCLEAWEWLKLTSDQIQDGGRAQIGNG